MDLTWIWTWFNFVDLDLTWLDAKPCGLGLDLDLRIAGLAHHWTRDSKNWRVYWVNWNIFWAMLFPNSNRNLRARGWQLEVHSQKYIPIKHAFPGWRWVWNSLIVLSFYKIRSKWLQQKFFSTMHFKMPPKKKQQKSLPRSESKKKFSACSHYNNAVNFWYVDYETI